MAKLETKIGKYLCYLLRHDEDFVLDSEGWVNIVRIVSKLKQKFDALKSKEDIEIVDIIMDIIKTDTKKRYSAKTSSGVVWIRCDYGHSNKNINIEYANNVPPVFLYHGTSKENYEKIVETGKIDMMDRNHVHLSEDVSMAIKVGKRHGDPVVIVINSYDMYKNGIVFHKVENKTWLVDEAIDMCYENKLINTETCNILNNSTEEINNYNFSSNIDCDYIMEKISDHDSLMTVKDINNMFNKLVKLGKGDYKVNICGSEKYYLYIINRSKNKLISIDTSPDEFEEYFSTK